MREQHREVVKKEESNSSNNTASHEVETAVITISMGDGISELCK